MHRVWQPGERWVFGFVQKPSPAAEGLVESVPQAGDPEEVPGVFLASAAGVHG